MRRRTRWLAVGLATAVVVILAALAIPALPHVLRALAVARIQAATGRATTIDSLALDLRAGTLSVRGVRLADRDGDTLATIGQLDARIRLRALLTGHLWVRDLAVKDSTVRVVRFSENEFNISDLIQRHEGGTGLDVTVDRFTLAGGTVLLEDRSVSPTRLWTSEDFSIVARHLSTRRDDGEADASSTINGAPVSVRLEQLRLVPIHLRAVVRAQQIDLALARIYLPSDVPVILDRGRLDTTVAIALDARTGLRVHADGQIADAVLIRRQQRDPFMVAPAIRVAVRDFTVGNDGGLAVGRVELAGATTLINGDASPPTRFELPRVTLRADGLAWPVQGPAKVELASSVPGGGELTVRGDVTAQPASANVAVRLTRVNLTPWGRYVAPWLSVSGTGEVALTVQAALEPVVTATGHGTARATRVVVADAARQLIALEQAEVSGLELKWPSHITLGRVRLRRPSTVVERDATGAIGVPGVAPDPGSGETAAPATDPSPTRTPQLRVAIGELGIEDGAVTWRDLSVKPATTIRLAGVRFLAKDATWPASGPVDMQLRAVTPGGGTVELNGQVGIQPRTADVQLTARRVALAPYAPYLPVAVPVRGSADATLSASLSHDVDLKARVRGTVAVGRFSAADGRRRVLSAERVEARGLEVDWPGRVIVDRLTFWRPWALVERDERGAFTLRSLLTPTTAASNGAGAPASSGTPATDGTGIGRTIVVGDLQVHDGGARVVDRSVSPPFAEDLSRLSVRVRGLATSSETPARLNLRASLGAGTVAVQGTVRALDGPISLDLSGEVRDLAVLRLNPYLQHFVGWSASQGRLSTRIGARVNGGVLEAAKVIHLGRLQVQRAAADDTARQRIGLPLGVIVALLKDRRGDIRLSLPVGGRLDDPRFDYSEAMWSAVRAVAIKAMALPVSWIGRLRFSEDSKIQDVEIDPLAFQRGTATVAPEASPRLDRLAAFMQSLPDVRIIATPVVSLGDIEALTTQAIAARIKALATERRTPEVEAARHLFVQQFPRQEPPAELEDIVAALREVEEPSAAEAGALARERVRAVRDALKKADIDPNRIALNNDAGALETLDGGHVELGLTDQLKPRRTLAELLRSLVEALQRRLAAVRDRG